MRFALLLLLLLMPSKLPANTELDRAIHLYQSGEFTEATTVLSLLSRSSPSDSDVRLWLGKSYLKTRQWDKAVGEMEKAVQLEPSSARFQLWLGRACGARAAHSFFITGFGWAKRVIRAFETARRLSPEDIDVRFDLLQFYIDAPGMVGGGKDKADAEAKAISKLSAKRGYAARAMIFEKNKQWDLAKKELVQATIEYPDDPDLCNDLADFLLDRKDFEGALSYAKRALTMDNNSKKARLVRAASATHLHVDLDESESFLKELAQGPLGDEDPAFEEVYYWLGECYLAKGDKAKAQASLQTALVFNPDYHRARNTISEMR
jgi:Tfp pilus assembly protein PilF